MKLPLGNSGTSDLRFVTDTVQTVQYSDSQCTVQVYTLLPPRQPPTSRSLLTLVLFRIKKKCLGLKKLINLKNLGLNLKKNCVKKVKVKKKCV